MPVIQATTTEEDGGTTSEQKQALIQRPMQTFVEVMGRGEKTFVVHLEPDGSIRYQRAPLKSAERYEHADISD